MEQDNEFFDLVGRDRADGFEFEPSHTPDARSLIAKIRARQQRFATARRATTAKELLEELEDIEGYEMRYLNRKDQ
jgi:hypothetical protein